MILGVTLWSAFGLNGLLFPLVLGALGLVASTIGVHCVKAKKNELPMKAMIYGNCC